MRSFPAGGVRLLVAGVAGLLVVLSLSPVGAASANISHSYHAGQAITNGSIVSLDPARSDYVEPADVTNGSRLLGVVLASNDSLLAVDASADKIQVANNGIVSTLVSTLNGPINVGDQIGVSPFSGIGMRAAPGSHAIGLAQTDFNQNSTGAVTKTVTDKGGQKHQITLGYVQLAIAISTAGDQGQASGLQRFAQNLTGHTVSTTRVVLSLLIAIVALAILVTLTYAAIYGSIISIGRNPLAKYAVFRTLTAVVGMAILTAITAAVSIFFLLH